MYFTIFIKSNLFESKLILVNATLCNTQMSCNTLYYFEFFSLPVGILTN